ncbi:MAG: c-type cytochrome [Proteobacteria bacterium]|nr:c-type cytochrome [Pseudomonadota bacterium]MDA0927419.1 c-type cytochrome [Pseudomonadota bacterium]
MTTTKTSFTALTAIAMAVLAQTAFSDFDQWQINELFTNSDGTVQFIELITTAPNQGDLSGLTLMTRDAVNSQQKSVSFSSNLQGDTSNRTLLVATQGFVNLTGLEPELLIDSLFLFTEGGSVDFANGIATLSYGAAQLPKNGVQSINALLQPQAPDPTAYSGLSANPSTTSPAQFDGVSILNLPILNAPGIGVANVTFDVNLATTQFVLRSDFYLYGAGITAGDTPATFQGSTLSIPLLPIGTEHYAFDLTLVGEDPITFSNPTNIVITPVPTPKPEPEPGPDPTQQSIERGAQLYLSKNCASCHGAGGAGGIGPALLGHNSSSLDFLQTTIDSTMPQGNPSQCVDSSTETCATDISNYIIGQFGSGL